MSLRLGMMAVAAAAFVALGGCANNKQAAERDSLLDQNKKLQEQLQSEQAARQAADARANAATGQLTAPGTDTTAAPGTGAGEGGGTLDLTGSGTTGGARGGRTPAAPNLGGDIGSSINAAGEVVLEIRGDVLFDSGKATVKPTAKKTLDTLAAQIKKSYSGQTLRIEGHTDASPVKNSGWDDNWDLGAARARAVLLYLSSKGVPQKNMYIASMAANNPKNTKNPALNRRVDIVVVKNAR